MICSSHILVSLVWYCFHGTRVFVIVASSHLPGCAYLGMIFCSLLAFCLFCTPFQFLQSGPCVSLCLLCFLEVCHVSIFFLLSMSALYVSHYLWFYFDKPVSCLCYVQFAVSLNLICPCCVPSCLHFPRAFINVNVKIQILIY